MIYQPWRLTFIRMAHDVDVDDRSAVSETQMEPITVNVVHVVARGRHIVRVKI